MRDFLVPSKTCPHPEEPGRVSIRAGVSKDARVVMQRPPLLLRPTLFTSDCPGAVGISARGNDGDLHSVLRRRQPGLDAGPCGGRARRHPGIPESVHLVEGGDVGEPDERTRSEEQTSELQSLM